MTVRPQIWVGIDVGKTSHHACAIDETGKVCWSQKLTNEQRTIEQLIDRARNTAAQVQWAIDLTSALALMLITVLLAASQPVVYVPGRVVNTMTGVFRGEGKTDCGHSVRGVLPVAGPKDRSASCLLGDTSATGRTPPSVSGRTRCGLIGA